MGKQRDPLAELEEAYSAYMTLEKSRKVKKSEDNPPADPDHVDDGERETDAEPRDTADEAAEAAAKKRVDDLDKSRRDDDDDEDDEDDDDLDKSLSGEDGRDEEKKIQKCRKCGHSMRKSQKFCDECGEKMSKSKGASTKAIRDSQDAYSDGDSDDLHGEDEDIPEEQGDGDDDTIITNMGRRVKPGVKKSMRDYYYGDLIKSTGFTGEFFDANPAVEQMADVVGEYLEASDRRVSTLTRSVTSLTKSLKETQKMLEKSLHAQAALLRSNTSMQGQIDAITAQPSDIPATGFQTGWASGVDQLAKSQAGKNQTTSKLTKSMVREKLSKGMVNEVVEPYLLSDFDSNMARGLTADQFVADFLTDDQRKMLGL